jgi:CRP-like cAMP-binding protein
VFQTWGRRALEKLTYFFRPVVYAKRQIVYSEQDEPTDMYLIKSGEFRLVKRIGADMTHRVRHIEVAILTEGEIFGEEDLVLDQAR